MSLYEIVHTEDRGRAAIASQDVPAGTDIMSEQSIAYIVKDRYRMLVCQWCCKFCYGDNQQVYALNESDKYRYCSQTCIEKDYTTHKYEVDILSRLDKVKDLTSSDDEAQKAIELEPMRLIIRAAAKKKVLLEEAAAAAAAKGDGNDKSKDGTEVDKQPTKTEEQDNEESKASNSIPTGLANSFDDLLKLEGIIDTREDTEALEQYLSTVSKKLMILLRLANLSLTHDEIRHLLLACQCNAHTIGGNGHTMKQHVSIGYYPLVSMLNHSCVPNCIHYFVCSPHRPPILKIRTIRDVCKGQELVYSYVPLYQSTETRRGHLASAYSFDCTCPRCVYLESEDTGKTTANAASVEGQHLDTMYALFDMTDDECIFEPETSTALNGITLCMQRIIATRDAIGRKVELDMLLSKLNSTLQITVNEDGSPDMASGGISHFHQTLFHGYNSAVQTIESLIIMNNDSNNNNEDSEGAMGESQGAVGDVIRLNNNEKVKYMKYLVFYGLLALSCIKTFVGVPQLETAQIEYTVYKALKAVISSGRCDDQTMIDTAAMGISVSEGSGEQGEEELATLLRSCTVVVMDILVSNEVIRAPTTTYTAPTPAPTTAEPVLFEFINASTSTDGVVVKLLGHTLSKIIQAALFDHCCESATLMGDGSGGRTVAGCYEVLRDSYKDTAEQHAAVCRSVAEESLV